MRGLILLSLCLQVACSGTGVNDTDNTFYTWIDERGVLHTQKKVSNIPVKAAASLNDNDAPVTTAKEKIVSTEIIQSNYTSSDDIDKKIAGDKLYSWTQDGRQVIAQLGPTPVTEKIKTKTNNTIYSEKLKNFREGNEILLSDILSKEINLERFYLTTKKSGEDYILIEIDIPGIQSLKLNSYTINNKVALPKINILKSSYDSSPSIKEAFDSYTDETWSSYGRFTGQINIPTNARYILFRPSTTLGVVETNDGDITMIDFGVIQITY